MHTFIRPLIASAALAAAAHSPVAQANTSTLDFEPADLTGLYFAGDSFFQSGFRMAVEADFDTVDVGADNR